MVQFLELIRNSSNYNYKINGDKTYLFSNTTLPPKTIWIWTNKHIVLATLKHGSLRTMNKRKVVSFLRFKLVKFENNFATLIKGKHRNTILHTRCAIWMWCRTAIKSTSQWREAVGKYLAQFSPEAAAFCHLKILILFGYQKCFRLYSSDVVVQEMRVFGYRLIYF